MSTHKPVRTDSLFLGAAKKLRDDNVVFEHDGIHYSVSGHGKSWPRLSFAKRSDEDCTNIRRFWIKPDCLLISDDQKSAIVIEVCKSWQNFMAKRFQNSLENRKHLRIFKDEKTEIEVGQIEVIYAFVSDGNDWMLSHIANVPDCGGRFCEGIERWRRIEDVDLGAIISAAKPRNEIIELSRQRPENQMGIASDHGKNVGFRSAIPSI